MQAMYGVVSGSDPFYAGRTLHGLISRPDLTGQWYPHDHDQLLNLQQVGTMCTASLALHETALFTPETAARNTQVCGKQP